MVTHDGGWSVFTKPHSHVLGSATLRTCLSRLVGVLRSGARGVVVICLNMINAVYWGLTAAWRDGVSARASSARRMNKWTIWLRQIMVCLRRSRSAFAG